jgi:outer membrane immunogenic protein
MVGSGLAVAGTTAFYDDGFFLVDESQTHVGWTVGAGLEVAVADNLSIDMLYRYSDYGEVGYGGVTSPPYDASFTTHQITAGLNFRF